MITGGATVLHASEPIAADLPDAKPGEPFAAGDPRAFDAMVAAHQDRVARLAQRLLGWRADVDDVVQDVFLAAWKGMRRFRGDARVETWLARITINACRRHHRRHRLRQLVPLGGKDPAAAVDEAASDAETLARVRSAVARLPMRYREVTVLRYLEGLSSRETAETLGLSSNVVDVRLHRARERLRVLLGGPAEGETE